MDDPALEQTYILGRSLPESVFRVDFYYPVLGRDLYYSASDIHPRVVDLKDVRKCMRSWRNSVVGVCPEAALARQILPLSLYQPIVVSSVFCCSFSDSTIIQTEFVFTLGLRRDGQG